MSATLFGRCVRRDDRERVAGGDGVALLDAQLADRPRLVGGDLVLHLPRLDDEEQLALLDLRALLDEDLPHVALHRRGERVTATAATAALPRAAGRLARPAAGGGSRAVGGRPPASVGRADDLDVEALAGDLDGVLLLDLLRLIVI